MKKYFSISVFSYEQGKFATLFFDITKHKFDEAENARYRRTFQFLSEAAIFFLSLETEEDFLSELSSGLVAFLPDKETIIYLSDPEAGGALRARRHIGFIADHLENAESVLGSKIGKRTYRIPPIIRKLLLQGELNLFPDNFREFLGEFLDKDTAAKLSERLALRTVRYIGLVAAETIFGVVVILSDEDQVKLEHEEFINIFVRFGSFALRRLRMEQDLLAAKNAAEAGNKAKRDFLANMSHELRTPLNGILGMATLLRETEIDSRQAEYLSMLTFSAENLLGLVSDLLDFSRIDSGSLKIQSAWFDLKRLVSVTLAGLETSARNKGILLRHTVDTNCERYFGDRMRIAQILANLLSNAVKYTDRGEVSLDITQKETLEISVRDTGIGIPPDLRDSIFEGFQVAESPYTKSRGRLGLGLAITRNLVELMGGTMQLESVPDRGSTFTVKLPPARISEKKAFEGNPAERPGVFGSVGSGPASSASKGGWILIVEDEAINRLFLTTFLRGKGFRADEAKDGVIAIERAQANDYDLILMDVSMPNKDGISATKELRHWEKETGRAPVLIIALTAHAYDDDLKACLGAGMNDFLVKPVQESILLAKITDSLRNLH